MCPACIATAAWIAAGTTSAGAFFGLVIKGLPRERPRTDRRGPAAMSPEAYQERQAAENHCKHDDSCEDNPDRLPVRDDRD